MDNINWNVDVRVNLFETNIRILGGMLSAHLLAIDEDLQLMEEGTYDGGINAIWLFLDLFVLQHVQIAHRSGVPNLLIW